MGGKLPTLPSSDRRAFCGAACGAVAVPLGLYPTDVDSTTIEVHVA